MQAKTPLAVQSRSKTVELPGSGLRCSPSHMTSAGHALCNRHHQLASSIDMNDLALFRIVQAVL